MSNTNTDFSSRCNILADLWMNYKLDETFQDFVEYNDLGLPLAFFVSQEIIKTNDMVTNYINETWELLLEAVGTKDTGFASLDDLLMGFEE